MNGAGGNLGAIFSAKLSTDLALTKAELEGTVKAYLQKPLNLPPAFRMLNKSLSTLGQTKKRSTGPGPWQCS